jgi:hypothetical protein
LDNLLVDQGVDRIEPKAILQHALALASSSNANLQSSWCLNDRAPSPAADRGYAPTRARAMLALKHSWRERGPLKPGKMQVDTPEWMKNRPEYERVID